MQQLSNSDSQTPAGRAQLINQVFEVIRLSYPSFKKTEDYHGEVGALKRIWSHHLQGIPDERIMQALEKLPEFHPKYEPTIGEFKALCKPPRPEHTDMPPRALLPDMSDKAKAWAQCCRAFARQFPGMPYQDQESNDYDHFVADIPTPPGPDLRGHQAAWRELKNKFERHWA